MPFWKMERKYFDILNNGLRGLSLGLGAYLCSPISENNLDIWNIDIISNKRWTWAFSNNFIIVDANECHIACEDVKLLLCLSRSFVRSWNTEKFVWSMRSANNYVVSQFWWITNKSSPLFQCVSKCLMTKSRTQIRKLNNRMLVGGFCSHLTS